MAILMLIVIIFAINDSELRSSYFDIAIYILAFCGIVNGYVTARFLTFFVTTELCQAVIISAFGLPTLFISTRFFELIIAISTN